LTARPECRRGSARSFWIATAASARSDLVFVVDNSTAFGCRGPPAPPAFGIHQRLRRSHVIIEKVLDAHAVIGESPTWAAHEAAQYWLRSGMYSAPSSSAPTGRVRQLSM